MPNLKPLTAKICTVKKNDPRYKPTPAPIFKPKGNGNPLIDPKAVKPLNSPVKKTTERDIIRHMKNDHGFDKGSAKYDKRDIMSIPDTVAKVKISGKITSTKYKVTKREKRKPSSAEKGNGNVTALGGAGASFLSPKITRKITQNDRKKFSKNKPIQRRNKVKVVPRPYEQVAKDTRKPLTKKIGGTKHSKRIYKQGMKHVRSTGNAHTEFVDMTKTTGDPNDLLTVGITRHNPTGKPVKGYKIENDRVFGEPAPIKPFKKPEFHMASYSQIDFSKM